MREFHKQIYEMFLESQYWPPERMLEYQHSQLTQLLRHAKADVPFYADRLDCVFKKNGDIDWDRWHEIPIVKRSDLVNEKNDMLASELPPGHGPTKEVYSSGSSRKGHFHNPKSFGNMGIRNGCVSVRSLARHGLVTEFRVFARCQS